MNNTETVISAERARIFSQIKSTYSDSDQKMLPVIGAEDFAKAVAEDKIIHITVPALQKFLTDAAKLQKEKPEDESLVKAQNDLLCLSPVKVVGENGATQIYFADTIDVEKGVYKENSLNKRLNRHGKEYGVHKRQSTKADLLKSAKDFASVDYDRHVGDHSEVMIKVKENLKNHFTSLGDDDHDEIEKYLTGTKTVTKAKKKVNEPLLKSDVYYAFTSQYDNTKGLVFKKNGAELKTMLQAKLDCLKEKDTALRTELGVLRETLVEADVKFVENYEYGYSVPDSYGAVKTDSSYSATKTNEELQKKLNRFWELSWQCQSLKSDMKILATLLNNVKEKDSYNITASQLTVLEKAADVEDLLEKGGAHKKHKYLKIENGKYIYNHDEMTVKDHRAAMNFHAQEEEKTRRKMLQYSGGSPSKEDADERDMHEEQFHAHKKAAKEKTEKPPINEIKSQYDELVDRNAHGEAALLLANHFGTKKEQDRIKEINYTHQQHGSLLPELRDERDAIMNKYYYKHFKKQVGDEKVSKSFDILKGVETAAV